MESEVKRTHLEIGLRMHFGAKPGFLRDDFAK
jgi:hypothetical protein